MQLITCMSVIQLGVEPPLSFVNRYLSDRLLLHKTLQRHKALKLPHNYQYKSPGEAGWAIKKLLLEAHPMGALVSIITVAHTFGTSIPIVTNSVAMATVVLTLKGAKRTTSLYYNLKMKVVEAVHSALPEEEEDKDGFFEVANPIMSRGIVFVPPLTLIFRQKNGYYRKEQDDIEESFSLINQQAAGQSASESFIRLEKNEIGGLPILSALVSLATLTASRNLKFRFPVSCQPLKVHKILKTFLRSYYFDFSGILSIFFRIFCRWGKDPRRPSIPRLTTGYSFVIELHTLFQRRRERLSYCVIVFRFHSFSHTHARKKRIDIIFEPFTTCEVQTSTVIYDVVIRQVFGIIVLKLIPLLGYSIGSLETTHEVNFDLQKGRIF
eukprot:sb/3465669/